MNSSYLNARDFGASGSRYTTCAHTTAGSPFVTLDDIGDFKVGDEVLITKCNVHFPARALFERRDTNPINTRKWRHSQPLGDRVELEGYTGIEGSWVPYIIDLWPENPDVFRWTNDNGTNWHEDVPINKGGWNELENGVRVKINEFEQRSWGATAVIICCDRLIADVLEVNGNTIKLSEVPNLTAVGEIMHSDTGPIQRAIDAAIEQKKNVMLPNGTYRLTKSLRIENASGFTFEGENAVNTVLDNSLGNVGIESHEGSCFIIMGGTEINLKNLSMFGGMGFDERKKAGNLMCKGGTSVWGFYFVKSNATYIHDADRVYVENCHARRMSAECFYASSHSRSSDFEPAEYGRGITFMRCSVEDCARNAFNNNDYAEGTSVLYCRVRNVGGNAWEGASRFVKIHGCYFRNCGPLGLGNVRSRNPDLERLGTGQHIITDNYFESGICYGGAMIGIGSTASQVTVANNVFINYNSTCVSASGSTGFTDRPSENIIITGNSFDMTAIDSQSKPRTAIHITTNSVTAADNQIFVRGETDENVTGIYVSDDATRISVHDNTIASCGRGIVSEKVTGWVGTVTDDLTFYRREAPKPMLLRFRSHRYRGWKLAWEDGTESTIADFDPETRAFTLAEPRKMQNGDSFCLYCPENIRWAVHHNIIDNCTLPLSIETYAARSAAVDNNQI